MPTPYDNGIALWHWKGDAVGETTIDQLAQTIKRWAPAVTDLIVKTCDGAEWQGRYDKSAALRISGPDRIDQWTETLQKYGVGFHAWVVVKGLNISAEADKIIQTCTVLGVKSLILDVEPYSGYFRGGKDSIRPLMAAIRAAIPGNFHIGLSIDPRPQHYHVIFPDEWFPFVQSVHPQIYWAAFQQSPENALDTAFSTWSGFGRPIYPALQGNADSDSMNRARTLALSKYRVQGLSWWRLGAIGPAQWPGINVAIDGSVPSPAGGDQSGGHFGRKIIVAPDGPGYEDGTFENKTESKPELNPAGKPASVLLKVFSNSDNGPIKYKATGNVSSTVWARWDPQIDQSGWYEITAFVSGQHASTANARYKVHHGNSTQTDTEVTIAQVHYVDSWVPLGVYKFDADDPTAGIVQLNDLTGESGKEISFGAIRWRQVLGIEPREPFLADGFDAPVGTPEERRSPDVWPTKWIDATGYAIRYRIGTPQVAYHTGADLNLNAPYYDADAHSPVYAAASGVVTYVGRIIGWGITIIIRHDPLIASGQVVYTRSSHVELPRVQRGQRVARGEQIANVGNAEGAYPYHLHFDVSTSTILDVQPGHWPGLNLNNLLSNYADPRLFVAQHRPRE